MEKHSKAIEFLEKRLHATKLVSMETGGEVSQNSPSVVVLLLSFFVV